MVQTPFDAQNNTQNHRLSKLIFKLQPEVAFLALAIPIFLWISWSSLYFQLPTTGYWRDIWEHAAAINEWMKNLWHPGNPHLPIGTTSPRYMPYFFVLVLLGKAFNLTALQALGIGGIMNIAMLLAGIFLFTREYFNNRWAPVVGLMVFLGGWGMGWVYTSNYQLRSLFYVISYPSLFATGLSFLTLWVSLRILRLSQTHVGHYLLLGIMVAVLFISHPLTGAFAICALGILTFFEFTTSIKARCKVLVAIAMGALIADFWPYFSVWDLLLNTPRSALWDPNASTQTSWIEQLHLVKPTRLGKFYDPKVFAVTTGPALLSLPVLIYLIAKKRELFIVVGFLAMAFPFLGNLFVKIPMGMRFLYYVVFFMHVSLIWAVLQTAPHWQSFFRQGVVAAAKEKAVVVALSLILAFSFLWNVALAGIMFAGFHPQLGMDAPYELRPIERYANLQPVIDTTQRIAALLPENAVVLGVPWQAWPLPTFKGKITSTLNTNPFVKNSAKRNVDARRFFTLDMTHQERCEIVQRYQTTHILFRADSKKIIGLEKLRNLGNSIGKVKAYEIIKVATC